MPGSNENHNAEEPVNRSLRKLENLDVSNTYYATLTTLATSVALQTATMHIPFFDGSNIPLKDFMQDVKIGLQLIPPAVEPMYLLSVISKLRGKARESINNLVLASVADFEEHLKSHFAPAKSYSHYIQAIINTYMKQGETVRDFYTRLSSLMRSAQAAARNALDLDQDAADCLKPQLDLLALEAFINGLPDAWRVGMAIKEPTTLTEALTTALNLEKYHVSRGEHTRFRLAQVVNTEAAEDHESRVTNNHPQSPRRVELNDSNTFNRHDMAYQFDHHKDTTFHHTILQDRKLIAPSQCSYGTELNTSRPANRKPTCILKNNASQDSSQNSSPYRPSPSEPLLGYNFHPGCQQHPYVAPPYEVPPLHYPPMIMSPCHQMPMPYYYPHPPMCSFSPYPIQRNSNGPPLDNRSRSTSPHPYGNQNVKSYSRPTSPCRKECQNDNNM